jgi:UDP-N-acetylglucosamine 1-carboxyvinyltransferase
MDIKVKGGQVLSGTVDASGYKNSAVCLIPASLLFDKPVTFTNVPDISDVDRLVAVLTKLGSKIVRDRKNSKITIDNSKIRFEELNRGDLGNMKGISLLWGPMLARFRKVVFKELPGGCTLGFRTLTPHYKAFTDLGVVVKEDKHSAKMDASGACGREIFLTEMSPTATENAIMLAIGLKGTTKIVGAASEPQVQDLCNFLVSCGARIGGIASSILNIEGEVQLVPNEHEIISDDHETATFLAMGALTGGRVKVNNVKKWTFEPIKKTFELFGVDIIYDKDSAVVEKSRIIPRIEKGRGYLLIKPRQWPGLMVDNLPIFIPLALAAKEGQFLFHNWMYEGGLFWVSELQKLGANIIIADPHRVIVTSGQKLSADIMEAPYIIRAVVAMVMSAMIAEGETTILNADSLYRGHPHFAENLRKLGAKIEVVK